MPSTITEKQKILSRLEIAQLTEFAVDYGASLLMSGGEIWRADVMTRRIFDIYQVKNAEIFMLPHNILISVKPEGESESVVCHREVGEIHVNLEQLTALNRLVWSLRDAPLPTAELGQKLREVSVGHVYPRYMIIAGMALALVSLSYYFRAGVMGAVLVALGIAVAMGFQMYLGGRLHVNHFLLCGASAFLAGCVLMLGSALGLHPDPYLLMVINCIGLIPGIPLINACREILLGKVLNGGLLFMTAFIETLAVACGFSLASFCLAFLL